jgi:hypothetical protein
MQAGNRCACGIGNGGLAEARPGRRKSLNYLTTEIAALKRHPSLRHLPVCHRPEPGWAHIDSGRGLDVGGDFHDLFLDGPHH